jgi:hypothetical protein
MLSMTGGAPSVVLLELQIPSRCFRYVSTTDWWQNSVSKALMSDHNCSNT